MGNMFNKLAQYITKAIARHRAKMALIDTIDAKLTEMFKDLKRLQLLNLIQHSPENSEAIFMVAEEYFEKLKGNWYMKSEFKKWCINYNNGVFPDWFKER